MENEKRLIDISEFPLLPTRLEGDMSEYERGYLDAQANMNALPTVDAVEVVHGRWLDNGMCNHKPSRFRNPDKWTVYKCSECGYSNGRRKNANYCPNCGAKMDGDGNDQ